jgi:hypothetical protein
VPNATLQKSSLETFMEHDSDFIDEEGSSVE